MSLSGIQEFNLNNFTSNTLLLFLLILPSCSQNKEPDTKQITLCQTNGEWCESTTSKNKTAILFPKKIPYLKPFPVQIKIKKENKIHIQKTHIQFSMQGMQMGMNQFSFNKKNDNNFKQILQTQVVLPVCITGRKDWLVEINVNTNINNFKTFFLITID